MQRIVHLSDTHILSKEDTDLLGFYPCDTLKLIVQKINNLQPRPHAILLTGDAVEKGTEEEYLLFKKLLRPLAIPVYWLPGNHDNATEMHKASDARLFSNQRSVLAGGWNIVLLDSQVPGEDHGHISAEEFDHLSAELNQHPQKPTLVALHHTPCSPCVNPGCQLDNHEELLALLQLHAQVKLVLAGHTHQAETIKAGNLSVFTAPSAVAQVLHPSEKAALKVDDFLACHDIEGSYVGFGVFDLFSDGSYTPKLHRIEIDTSSA